MGHWAEQAQCAVTNAVVPNGLIVDLTDVNYVDSIGEQLLRRLRSFGAEFVPGNVYVKRVCERLRLACVNGTTPRHKRRQDVTEHNHSIAHPHIG